MPLSPQEIFAAWAPAESAWSTWAKPILFANTPTGTTEQTSENLPPVDALAYVRHAALVVDLPGAESALMGLALAQIGYQPVPLYNATTAPGALINMSPIARVLADGADALRALTIKPTTRPAFLLNADRDDHTANAQAPGRFDNRWRIAPQDMPSATFLKEHGVQDVIVITAKVKDDLAHILHRYQEAKLTLKRAADGVHAPAALNVPRPNNFRASWYRALVFAGLRRNAAGGFGAMTPDVSESSSYYGGG